MKESKSRILDGESTFLGDVWRGINAPEDVISNIRKHIDEFMLVTGALGIVESVATISPRVFLASALDLGLGAADLARAGVKVRKMTPP